MKRLTALFLSIFLFAVNASELALQNKTEGLFHAYFPTSVWDSATNKPSFIRTKNEMVSLHPAGNSELHKQFFIDLFTSEENMKLYADRKACTEEQALAMYERHYNVWKIFGFRAGFVIHKNETPIGFLGIGLSGVSGIGEIYFILDHKYINQKLGQVAAFEIMNWAAFLKDTQVPVFLEKPLDSVFATVSLDNPRSIHLLTKLGLKNPLESDIERFKGTCIIPEEAEVIQKEIDGRSFFMLTNSRHGLEKAIFIKHL